MFAIESLESAHGAAVERLGPLTLTLSPREREPLAKLRVA